MRWDLCLFYIIAPGYRCSFVDQRLNSVFGFLIKFQCYCIIYIVNRLWTRDAVMNFFCRQRLRKSTGNIAPDLLAVNPTGTGPVGF